MVTIDLKQLPSKLQKRHPLMSSAGLIARLAVDEDYKGKGYGEWLLIDALLKLLMASDTVAFPYIVVDAKDGATAFYEKFAFFSFQTEKNKLFITVADVKKSIS